MWRKYEDFIKELSGVCLGEGGGFRVGCWTPMNTWGTYEHLGHL